MSKRVRALIGLRTIAGIAAVLLGFGGAAQAGPLAEAKALTISGFVRHAPVLHGSGRIIALPDGSEVVPVARIRESADYDIVADVVAPQPGRRPATLEYVRQVALVDSGHTELHLKSQNLTNGGETVRVTICVK